MLPRVIDIIDIYTYIIDMDIPDTSSKVETTVKSYFKLGNFP